MLNIETARLVLIAATPEMVCAELQDRAAFAMLLSAQVPETWPPEFYDRQTMAYTLQALEGGPEQIGWQSWYVLLHDAVPSKRTLIGIAGFKGRPDADATVEVGYSILEAFQRQGYGAEAVSGLVGWAFGQGVKRVNAETLPELIASQRLLERIGFTFVGAGSEAGVILYRRDAS